MFRLSQKTYFKKIKPFLVHPEHFVEVIKVIKHGQGYEHTNQIDL